MAHKKRQINIIWLEEEEFSEEGQTTVTKNKYDLVYEVLNGEEITKTVQTPMAEFTSEEYATLSEFLTLMDNKINTLEN